MEKFVCGDKVLVRRPAVHGGAWLSFTFSGKDDKYTYFDCGMRFRNDRIEMVHHNEETGYLLGTSIEIKPKWIPNKGELVAVTREGHDFWSVRIFLYINEENGKFVCRGENRTCSTEVEWDCCEPVEDHFTIAKNEE